MLSPSIWPSVALSPWITPVTGKAPKRPDPRNPRGVLLQNEAFFPLMDGVINVVDNLYHSLAERGVYTHLAVASHPGYVDRHERICRLPSIPFPLSRPYRWPMPCRAASYLPNGLEDKIDIVHLHSGFANARAVMRWARRHNKSVVFTVHTKFRDKFSNAVGSFFGDIMYRDILWAMKHADVVTCPGQVFREQLLADGVPAHKLRLVRNGVSDWPATTRAERERMIMSDPLSKQVSEARGQGKAILLFVGQHIREKNPELLMDALAIMKAQGKGLLCLFVGGGDQTAALTAKAAKLGLKDDVIFVGRELNRVRLSMIYAMADLMTFPSTFETSGLVVMEAAQHGLPTVGIQGSSGVSEVLTDNENGFLAPLNAQRYAERVLAALADELTLARVRHRATQTVARNKDAMVDDFLSIYRELMPARVSLARALA